MTQRNTFLTDERTLKQTAVLTEIFVELRLESLDLGKAINLEMDPPGTIQSFTFLPSGLQTVIGYEGATNLFKQIRPGSLSDVWINGDEHKVHRIALVRGDDVDWYQWIYGVLEVVFSPKNSSRKRWVAEVTPPRGSLLTMSSAPDTRASGASDPSRTGEVV
jgi:hypothetical protein